MSSEDFNAAVGRRCKEIRVAAGATQDQVVRALGRAGVAWPLTRATRLETGAVTITPPLMVALAIALSTVSGRQLTLADLVPADADIQYEQLGISGERLHEALRGGIPAASGFHAPEAAAPFSEGWSTADDKALQELGCSPKELLRHCAFLWGPGSTVSTERDRRAGPGATPQKRGRVTRELLAELQAAAERVREGMSQIAPPGHRFPPASPSARPSAGSRGSEPKTR